MRRSLVAALALAPVAYTLLPSAPAAPAPRFPQGELIIREECFGGGVEEVQMVRGGGGPGLGAVKQKKSPSAGVAASPPPSAPPPPASAPAADGQAAKRGEALSKDFLQKIPTGRSYESATQTTSVLPGSGGNPNMAGGATVEAEEAPAQAKPMDRKSTENLADDARDRAAEERTATDDAPDAPMLDWGATVYLSNDDSMSLASAQRVLWAVMHDAALSVREIRPHELLNYFSFDTVTPDADQTFDVLASAEQQGDRLSVAVSVKGSAPPPRPLDLTLVVDRSGSMSAEGRMAYVNRALTLATDQLHAGDRVDLVLFDHTVCTPIQNFVVGRDDASILRDAIQSIQPMGSTDVDLGLHTAYQVAKGHQDVQGRNRRMMILTDAQMNTGDVDPNTVSEIGKAFEADGIRLTGVGVGTDFNDKVLDLLTEKGKGAYVYLGSEAVVDRLFGATGFDSLVHTIAHDVHFSLNLPDSLAMERFYGEEASTTKEDVQPINYYAGTSQVFLQDLVVRNGRAAKSDPVELVIEYTDAVTGEPEKRVFRTTVGEMIAADPHNVRKGLALMAWSDLLTEQAMGGDPCGAPLRTYADRAAKLPDDAEIGFVNGLVRKQCGDFELPSVVTNRGVPFKVKVDSDVQLASAALECAGSRATDTLSASDQVATFEAPAGEVCELVLAGPVDMRAEVEVPQTGGDLRCVIRGGRISCS
jgi:Ca-activated chloride channel family protein